jgi:hypothetical protein
MFDTFESFVGRLSRQEIKIGEVQKFFEGTHKKGHLAEDLAALEKFNNSRGWGKKVEESIRRLFTIKQYSDAASAILKAVEVLGREKPFDIVENIQKATQGGPDFQDQPLSIISDELIKAGETFSSWNKSQIWTLSVLTKSGKILKWLRDNIQDRGDLKTFYELATISAGESDLEVDKVSAFYQSVIGYAPLLLDLDVKVSVLQNNFSASLRKDKMS